MKLYHSRLSPFARKVTILAGELGLTDRIELIHGNGNLMLRDTGFRAMNPSGQIPTLVSDDGEILFDSPVICEFLDAFAGGDLIGKGPQRWRNLRDQALGDGMCDAALQLRYDIGLRPANRQWDEWQAAWRGKIEDSLAWIEARTGHFDGRHDIGPISVFCALSFIDNRIPELCWRQTCPGVASWFDAYATRPAVAATHPY